MAEHEARHLPFISPISRLYLAHISPVSRPYLPQVRLLADSPVEVLDALSQVTLTFTLALALALSYTLTLIDALRPRWVGTSPLYFPNISPTLPGGGPLRGLHVAGRGDP